VSQAHRAAVQLKHPDELAVVTEVNENDDDDDPIEDEVDSTEDELQRRFNKMTFVVATRKLAQLPHWIKVSDYVSGLSLPMPKGATHVVLPRPSLIRT
jgi:hypothetical protein